MNIVLVRIDDRFIHGQILESWIPFLRAQSVIVANDTLARDQFQTTIMSMAIPDRILLRIIPVADVLQLMEDRDLDGKRTLVIVSNIEDAYTLYSSGVHFSSLNLGNNRATEGSRQISYSVWIHEKDEEKLKALISKGVEVFLQSVPREHPVDMRSLIPVSGV
ncbi:MAG TPA: PTS mannose/fructose/sorbose transporter subunit IIB [Deltaproteobacteria bacterium]|nr:PTS mannose/fructose/sorbose transporter subunit IIB [Deltaproteobacteria bacterium]